MTYLCDPEEIYRRSVALIQEEVDLSSVPEELRRIVVRLIHACGMGGYRGRFGLVLRYLPGGDHRLTIRKPDFGR